MVETVGVGGDVQDSGSDEGLETKRLRSEYFIRSANQIAIYLYSSIPAERVTTYPVVF